MESSRHACTKTVDLVFCCLCCCPPPEIVCGSLQSPGQQCDFGGRHVAIEKNFNDTIIKLINDDKYYNVQICIMVSNIHNFVSGKL